MQAIFVRVRGDAFDRAGAQDAEYVAGLRGAVVAAVDYGLEGIERGEEWVGPVPVVAVVQARRAARVGVSLDTVLRRYVAGDALLEGFVMEEAERGEHPYELGVLPGVLRAQAVVLDRLLGAVTGGYRDELARVGCSPQRRRVEQVRALLAGESLDGGAELGYELEGWHVGVIAVGAGAARAVRELGADRRLLSVEQGRESVWAWLGGRERRAFGALERVLAGTVSAEGMGVGELVGDGVVFALGEPARGLEGWRLTHRQAQAALMVALRRPRGCTRYADVALLASALKDEMLARALVEVYLAPLQDARGNGGAVLRATLRAYLAVECNVSSAAAKLNVARSTVANRLRTIEERLGRTLHPCPPELEVALLLDELAAVGGPPEIPIIR